MTNGDRLRAMNDEEISGADFFLCPYSDGCHKDNGECKQCVLEWLREEVKEDG